MKKDNSAIAGSTGCRRGGVSSSGRKIASGAKTGFAPCGGSEKSSLQAVKDLAEPQTGEKIAKSTPTHHEHETKWEIPI